MTGFFLYENDIMKLQTDEQSSISTGSTNEALKVMKS